MPTLQSFCAVLVCSGLVACGDSPAGAGRDPTVDSDSANGDPADNTDDDPDTSAAGRDAGQTSAAKPANRDASVEAGRSTPATTDSGTASDAHTGDEPSQALADAATAADASVTDPSDDGNPGSPEQPTGDCSMPPAAGELVGWASEAGGTTGGGAAAPSTMTSFSALKSAVTGDKPATLWIKGSLSGDLSIGSNKTLIGLCGAELHGHVEISGSTNIIVRNLKIVGYGVGNCALDPSFSASVGCSSGQDAMSIQKNAHHVWIDHCDISDGTDGNLDVTNAANYITVSWTKFHYTPRTDSTGDDSTGAAGHRFSNLVGGTDSPSLDDAHTLNITWHHNWWADNVVERQPRERFGKNHLFNNLWDSKQANYCVRAGKQAQVLVEGSVFDGVASAQQFNSSADKGTASITAKDNVYTSTSGSKDTGGGGTPFTEPPYKYSVDPTSGLEDAIRKQAGPR
jgi:pectate lyase